MARTDTPQTTDSMHSTTATATPVVESDDALRKRLLSRIAVAGVAIVGLLGGLAVYDSLNKPQVPVMPKMAAAPAEPEVTAVTTKKDEAVEEKLADAKAEEPKPADAEGVPERTDTPLAPSPVEKPSKPGKPLTPPATARQAAVKPAAPAAAPVKPDTPREIARVIPESSHPATAAARAPVPVPAAPVSAQARTQHAPASRPLTQATEAARRFLVQVGVFSNHANAEELMARLHEAGIPAQIESRVQVGPFASRAEADAARSKLKAFGLDDGILVRR